MRAPALPRATPLLTAAALRQLMAPHGWGNPAGRVGTPVGPVTPPGGSRAWYPLRLSNQRLGRALATSGRVCSSVLCETSKEVHIEACVGTYHSVFLWRLLHAACSGASVWDESL